MSITTSPALTTSISRPHVAFTPKAQLVTYWLSTLLVAFFIGSGGLAYAIQVPDVVQGVVALGFPVHFVVLLGVWKFLGSVAIVVPGFPRLKEWAYAGIIFDLTGAASTSFATNADWWHVAAPLSIALVVLASWALRPASRRLGGSPAPWLTH